MNSMNISEVITQYLIVNGIEVVFGIIGSANARIFNAINESNQIQLIATHHEQAAVMAMGAYYRTTGKMAAALVTAGGGSANALTGVMSNWADSIPGIIITGQEQTYYMDEYSNRRMIGIQGYKTDDVYRSITKAAVTLDVDNVHDVMVSAMTMTQSGRPGPIVIQVPFDTQGAKAPDAEIKRSVRVPSTGDFAYSKGNDLAGLIMARLRDAKNPVIIAGHGIKLSDSEDLFRQFIDKTNIPTILTWSAVDILEDDHPRNYGRAGVQGQRSSNMIVQNSDLVIVLGSRLSLLQTGYSRDDFAPHAHIIHVDVDCEETNKFDDPKRCTPINVDVGLLLLDLVEYANDIDLNIDDWVGYCDNMTAKFPRVMEEHKTKTTNSYVFIDELSDKVEDNTVIVTDMGTALLSGFYGFKVKRNQKFFTSLGLGEMGYGLAAAVGAGASGKQVLCLNCDGGMMMNLQELQTIKTYDLPVKVVIFNNDGYLMIKHTQNMLFGGKRTLVDKESGLELPEYSKIAEAFGYEYFTEDDIDAFLAYDGHAFLEVFMDPDQPFIPKVKGTKTSDNKIVAGRLEDMYPLIPLNELEEAMITGVNEQSKTLER